MQRRYCQYTRQTKAQAENFCVFQTAQQHQPALEKWPKFYVSLSNVPMSICENFGNLHQTSHYYDHHTHFSLASHNYKLMILFSPLVRYVRVRIFEYIRAAVLESDK